MKEQTHLQRCFLAKGGSIRITGDKELSRKLLSIAAKTPIAVAAALKTEAEKIMADSKQNYVPVDSDTLRTSGHVKNPKISAKGISIKLGYGGAASKYALIVHENPRAGKTGGVSPSGKKYKTWSKVGGWKYLEKPVMKHAAVMAINMSVTLKRFFTTQGK